MRNLTIVRRKSFVACLAKMKVYIEDPASTELVINKVPCRKLGDLKNGEEKTFQIDDSAARVYVIADTLSKEYCNEFFQIPEGNEDVSLAGQNKYNPAAGNAFRFDNNDGADVTANRKKGTRIGVVVLIAALVLGIVVGLLIGSRIVSNLFVGDKTFSVNEMDITLTSQFKEVTVQGFTAAYDSKNVAVLVLREDFSLAADFGDYSLEEYGHLVLKANGLSDTSLQRSAERLYFTYSYDNPENGATYTYVSHVYKSDDAFWLVQFATLVDHADDYADEIAEWANSVRFS